MKTLSEVLEINEKALWHLLSLIRKRRAYTTFEIPKRTGGTRKIDKPIELLQHVQRLIKDKILNEAPDLPVCVTAFRPGLSIRDNANPHCNKAILAKFDLKDFFPSVSFTRVIGIFKSFGFHETDAKGLAYLTTIQLEPTEENPSVLLHYERLRSQDISESYINHLRSEAGWKLRGMEHGIDFGDLKWEAHELIRDAKLMENERHRKPLPRRGLPQGAPTSPQLANLAARRLDSRLSGLARSLGFDYTRYADDLSFSSSDQKAKANVLKWAVERVVTESGFVLNSAKTSIMRAPATRQTTGLVVNGAAPRVKRSTIRRVRAMLHQKNLGRLSDNQTLRLAGYMSYIRMINNEQADSLMHWSNSRI